MIKKLHLYIIKEFICYFFFSLSVFSIFVLLNDLPNFINFFLSKNVSIFLVFKLIILIIPKILMLTIPMATISGILMSYGRLSEDNEVIAMKLSGIDHKTLTFPILIIVLIIFVLLLLCNHFIAPTSASMFKNTCNKIIIKNPISELKEKTINKINNYSLYAKKIDHKNNILYEVDIYKFDNNKSNGEIYHLFAPEATIKSYQNIIKIILKNGYLIRTDTFSNINDIIHATFKVYSFFITLNNEYESYSNSTIIGMSTKKIIKIIKICKKLNIKSNKYKVELWIRWIFAFNSISFAIVALPIGIMIKKHGRNIGFIISLCIILINYTAIIFAIDLSKNEIVPIFITMWSPSIITTVLGIYLFIKTIKN